MSLFNIGTVVKFYSEVPFSLQHTDGLVLKVVIYLALCVVKWQVYL